MSAMVFIYLGGGGCVLFALIGTVAAIALHGKRKQIEAQIHSEYTD